MQAKRKLAPALVEIIFDAAYLLFVISAGVYMLAAAQGRTAPMLYGAMALVLGCGDAFHLVPRIYAQATGKMDALVKPLGFGKLVTSVTMTVFYVLLYYVGIYVSGYARTAWITALVWGLAALRIALCLFPQNKWFTKGGCFTWAVYRNIPFVLLGLLVLVQYMLLGGGAFRLMWLAILLSFAFYLPVVLYSSKNPKLGMLMLPKTCAYIWIVCMGFSLL